MIGSTLRTYLVLKTPSKPRTSQGSSQVVEGLGIKEGDLLEFELTLERNLKVTVMKSTTQTRKPKKMAPAELQATLAKKKAFRGLTMDLTRGLMVQGSQEVMSELLLPAAAAAAAQGLPIRLPDPNQVPQPPVTLPCLVPLTSKPC